MGQYVTESEIKKNRFSRASELVSLGEQVLFWKAKKVLAKLKKTGSVMLNDIASEVKDILRVT
jgi:hypothetical protein